MIENTWIPIAGRSDSVQASEKQIIKSDYGQLDSSAELQSTSIIYRLSGVSVLRGAFGEESNVLFDIPEAGFIERIGAPMVIQEGLYFAMPDNATFEKLECEVVETLELDGEYEIPPVPKSALETEETLLIPDAAIYESDAFFPKETAQHLGTKNILGVKCSHILTWPVHYNPKTKKVSVHDIKLTVYYRKSDATDSICHRITHPEMKDLLIGYSDAEEESDDTKSDMKKQRMIIVTTKDLLPALKIYEAARRFRHFTEFAFMEDIITKYPGMESNMALYNYLKDEHDSQPVHHVVLAGDIDKVPTIMKTYGRLTYPSDSQYCRDEDDYIPKFALGRLPSSDISELERIAEISAYYNRFKRDCRKKVVLVAQSGENNAFIICSDSIYQYGVGSPYLMTKMYDTNTTFTQVADEINAGVGYVNYRGHGNEYGWASSNGLTLANLNQLDVKKNTPVIFSIACGTSKIHLPKCLSAEVIKKRQAISCIGASEESYRTANSIFDKFLWEVIINDKFTVIGDIFMYATNKLYMNSPGVYTEENINRYLMLGDPSMDLEEEVII